MSPPVALALTLFFIGYVLVRDYREAPRASNAVWIPILWFSINGSRQVSQWLGGGVRSFSAQALEDGNPIDKVVYSALIIAGIFVLSRRWQRVSELVRSNRFVIWFLLYEGISIIWSDFPLVALKRWGKGLGDPVMVLLLWSDPFPARAIAATIKRCAVFLIPLSVLFCKYYENLGRTFDGWGVSSYTGVTLDKNMLGYLLFAFGMFFVASLTYKSGQDRDSRVSHPDQIINLLLLAMIGWLLPIANSSTAIVSLAVGTTIVVTLRSPSVRKHFWSYALVAILLGTIVNASFSIQGTVAGAVGRKSNFTGRTGLWDVVLREPINPLIGVGYSSFWLGERLRRYWAMFPTSPPVQAHNGYLEIYINLGLIGVCFLVYFLLSGLIRMRRQLTHSLSTSPPRHERLIATFALPYGIAYLFYNVTEATFHGMNFLFAIFLVLAIGEPRVKAATVGVTNVTLDRSLPRQADNSIGGGSADEGLGRNVSGGTRPRLSWGRSPL